MKENKSTIEFFRKILYIYIAAIFFFSFLFMLPVANTEEINYVDSLFLSTSALSVTGLTTINISETLTVFGQTLLMIEMQLGGVGILVIISYLFFIMGKRMTVTSLWLVKRDQNQTSLKTVGTLSLSVLAITLLIQSIGFAFLFPEIKNHFEKTSEAVFVTAFHTVSSFTNGGFSLFEGGLIAFQEAKGMMFVTTLLIVLGGLGYPTLMEYIFNFRGKKTLFTKINVRLHLLLFGFGFVFYGLIEWNNGLKYFNLIDKLNNALFLSATTRSGGLNTLETSLLDTSTIILMLGLMFIGGASTSTAGGIRLTTFAVIVGKVLTVIKGNKAVNLFKKTLSEETVNKAFLIFTIFSVLFFAATFILSLFETHSVLAMAFETMSALTNTGLSMGITEELKTSSKIILIGLMVIGRIGILSVVYLVFKLDKKQYKYVEEELIVG